MPSISFSLPTLIEIYLSSTSWRWSDYHVYYIFLYIYICSILNFRNPVPHSLISVLPCLCIVQKILHPLQLTHHSLNLAPHPFQENCFLEVDHLSFNNSLCHPHLFSLPPLRWICSPDSLDSSLILLLISNVILEYDKGKGIKKGKQFHLWRCWNSSMSNWIFLHLFHGYMEDLDLVEEDLVLLVERCYLFFCFHLKNLSKYK